MIRFSFHSKSVSTRIFGKLGNNGASRRRPITPAHCRKIHPYHVDRVNNWSSGLPKTPVRTLILENHGGHYPFHLGCQILQVKVIILKNSWWPTQVGLFVCFWPMFVNRWRCIIQHPLQPPNDWVDHQDQVSAHHHHLPSHTQSSKLLDEAV